MWVNVYAENCDNIIMMRNWKLLAGPLVIVVIFVVFFVFFFNKKVPGPPKPPQKKVELPAPKLAELLPTKPVETLKQDAYEVKEETKTKDNEKEITKEHKREIVREKKELPGKPKLPVTTIAPNTIAKKPPQIVDFDKLNREFNSYGLSVWASELINNGILLNGYVKSEREKAAALSIARRYGSNITDMINIVTVYNVEESENKRVNQPLPFGR